MSNTDINSAMVAEIAGLRAEIAAMCGDIDALTPFLPAGWYRSGSGWSNGTSSVLPPNQSGNDGRVLTILRGSKKRFTKKGLIFAMNSVSVSC